MLVFFVLAIFTVALDFFNQAIELVEIKASTKQIEERELSSVNEPSQPIKVIRVSTIVRVALLIVKYFLLVADVVFVFVTVSNIMVTYVRSLKWKKAFPNPAPAAESKPRPT